MENDKKECRAYFLERSVYKKLFAKIQEKTIPCISIDQNK